VFDIHDPLGKSEKLTRGNMIRGVIAAGSLCSTGGSARGESVRLALVDPYGHAVGNEGHSRGTLQHTGLSSARREETPI
jgi:hypothetical protein